MNKESEDKEISKQLSKGSQIAFIGNGLSKVFSVGTKVIISRLMGPDGLGVYELLISLTRFGSMTGQLGLHQAVVYYISLFRKDDDDAKIASVIRSGFFVVGLFLAITAVVLLIFSQQIKALFFSTDTPNIVIIALVIMIVAFGLRNYLSMCYRGLKMIAQEVFINQFAFFFIILLIIGGFYIAKIDLSVYMLGYSLMGGAILSFCFSLPILFRHLRSGLSRIARLGILKQMMIYSIPLWGNVFLNIGAAQLDRMMLGIFSNTTQIGYFAAGNTIAVLLSFILHAFTPISQPMISEAYATSNRRQMSRIYRMLVRWGALSCIPLAGGFLLFGQPLLTLIFGTQFQAAYGILVFLVVGHVLNVLAGPAGNMLIMTNHQKASLFSLLVGFVTAVILHWWLIPIYQAVGAAIATASSLALTNLIRIWQVRYYLKISYDLMTTLKILLATALSTALVLYLQTISVSLVWLVLLYISATMGSLALLTDLLGMLRNMLSLKNKN